MLHRTHIGQYVAHLGRRTLGLFTLLFLVSVGNLLAENTISTASGSIDGHKLLLLTSPWGFLNTWNNNGGGSISQNLQVSTTDPKLGFHIYSSGKYLDFTIIVNNSIIANNVRLSGGNTNDYKYTLIPGTNRVDFSANNTENSGSTFAATATIFIYLVPPPAVYSQDSPAAKSIGQGLFLRTFPTATSLISPSTGSSATPRSMGSGSTTSGTTSLTPQSSQISNYANGENTPAGSFSYSYKFKLPPGRHGLNPDLGVSYVSTSTMSSLGVGFALQGLSSIELDQTFVAGSAPIGIAGDTTGEQYLLDGKRLFRLDSGLFHIQDENFEKIEKKVDSQSNIFWLVTKKDGTKSTYGSTIDSHLGTAKWVLNKVEDLNGNYCTIHYYQFHNECYPDLIIYGLNKALDGVTTSSVTFAAIKLVYQAIDSLGGSIAAPLDSIGHFDPKYIPGIGLVENHLELANILVFVKANSKGDQGTLLRGYSFYYKSSASTSLPLLKSIREYGSDFIYPGQGTDIKSGSPILSYNQSNINVYTGDAVHPYLGTQFLWNDITTLGFTDSNGKSGSDAITAGASLANYISLDNAQVNLASSSGNGLNKDLLKMESDTSSSTASTKSVVADVNGDGRSDVVQVIKSGAKKGWVSVFLGKDIVDTSTTALNTPDWQSTSAIGDGNNFLVGDVNGDGCADLVVQGTDGKVTVRQSDRTGGFDQSLSLTSTQLGVGDTIFLSDYFGRGSSQLVDVTAGTSSSSTVNIFSFNSTGFSSIPSSTNNLSFLLVKNKYWFLDINGDGIVDLVVQNCTTLSVYLGTGTTTGFVLTGNSMPILTTDSISFGDVNGDGRTDFIVTGQNGATNSGQIVIYSGLLSNSIWTQLWKSANGAIPSNTMSQWVDTNGDKKTDLILFPLYAVNNDVYITKVVVENSKWGVDLLTSVQIPEGGSVEATYTPAAQVTGAISPVSSSNPVAFPYSPDVSPRYLVTRIIKKDGLSSPIDTSYQYSNGLIAHRQPGVTSTSFIDWENSNGVYWGNLGFKQITETTGNSIKSSTYWQTTALHGKIGLVDEKSSTGTLLRETRYSYSLTSVTNAGFSRSVPLLTAQDLEEDYANPNGSSTLIKITKHSAMLYDTYGNITETDDDGYYSDVNSDQVKVTKFQYATNADKSVFMLSKEEKYEANGLGIPGPNKLVSQTVNYYDNMDFGVLTNGRISKTQRTIDTSIDYSISSPAIIPSNVSVNTFTYDTDPTSINTSSVPLGNLTSSTDGNGIKTNYSYDPDYQSYVSVVTIDPTGINQTKKTTYDWLMRSYISLEPNGKRTSLLYDGFGRLTQKTQSTDNDPNHDPKTDVVTDITYYSTGIESVDFTKGKPSYVKSSQRTGTTATGTAIYLDRYTYFDGLGRTIQTQTPAQVGFTIQDYGYDANGRNSWISIPYNRSLTSSSYVSPNTAIARTSFTYDSLGRQITTTLPDTSISKTFYSPKTVWTLDPKNHLSSIQNNINSTIKRTFTGDQRNFSPLSPPTLADSTTTVISFDAQQITVDSDGNQTVSNFDLLGRKRKLTSKDTGTWNYTFDANGNLLSQTDSIGKSTTFTYDSLNRMTGKFYSDGGTTPSVNIRYDENGHGADPITGKSYSIGKVTTTSWGSNSDSFTYDIHGRVISVTRSLVGYGTRTEAYTYDWINRPVTHSLPTQEMLTYTYGFDGNLTGISNGNTAYISSLLYNPLGKVTAMNFGNGTNTSYSYYDAIQGTDSGTGLSNSQQLAKIVVNGPYGSIQNVSYHYDTAGNITNKTDNLVSVASAAYGYDEQNRLTLQNGVTYTTYSATNNITSLGTTDPYSYDTSPTGHPHAVISRGSDTYSYDADGNMSLRNGAIFTYDSENRLTKVSLNGVSQVLNYYDSSRQRVSRTTGTKTTVNWFSDYEEIFDTSSNGSDLQKAPVYPVSTTGTVYSRTLFTDTSRFTQYPSKNLSIQAGVLSANIPTNGGVRLTASAPPNTQVRTRIISDVSMTISISNGTSSFQANLSAGVWTDIQGTLTTQSANIDICYPSVACNVRISGFYVGDGSSIPGMTSFRSRIMANGGHVADHTETGVQYFHQDHLGSSTAISDQDGNTVETVKYSPYGSLSDLTQKARDGRRFTDQEWDSATGLYYYNARYYDPNIGRFTQADPALWDGILMGRATLSLEELANPYMYAMNNPLLFTDPTGLIVLSIPSIYKMQAYEGTIPNGGGAMSLHGCAVTLEANVLYANGNTAVTPSTVRSNSENFGEGGGILFSNAATGSGLTTTNSKIQAQLTAAKYSELVASTDTQYYVGIEVNYDGVAGHHHWVGVNGISGNYYIISPTSQNDGTTGVGTLRGGQGWMTDANGNILVPLANVTAYQTFSKPVEAQTQQSGGSSASGSGSGGSNFLSQAWNALVSFFTGQQAD